MFIMALAILVIAFTLTYKNLSSLSTRFLVGIIVGWLLAAVALLLYVNKVNYYYSIIDKFLGIPPIYWRHALASINIDLLIDLLNFGVCLCIYSLLGFAIAFTRHAAFSRNDLLLYLGTAIPPLVEFLFNQPQIFRILDNWLTFEPQTMMLFDQISGINEVFRVINFGYILSAFGILFWYYFDYPNIRFFKNYTLLNILCLIPVMIIFSIIFSWWFPKLMLQPTAVKGFYNYVIPDIQRPALFLNFFSFIVDLFFAFMVVLIFKYNAIESYRRTRDVLINRSINTANLGVKTFSHSIKNYIVAIQAEAKYLTKCCPDEPEMRRSLDLILGYCAESLHSMERTQKLKNISLSLKPLELKNSLENTVTRCKTVSNIPISIYNSAETLRAYIDELHFSEVLFNIIRNAQEAIGERGDGHIEICLSKQAHWAVITISDNGPGISEDMIDQIFTPFISTKNSKTNWGIGLSYCHKIITGHDGKIEVKSAPGQGASFEIMLPAIAL